MVRRNLSSLASGLAIVVLAVGACSAGGNATPGASANASPAAPAATVEPTPVTATATPAATSTPAPTAAASSTATHSGRILFGVRAADGSSNIFSVLPDGSDQRQLTEGARNHLCAAYSADAKRITYCSDEGGAFEVWTMDPDGTKQTQLTHLGGRALWPDLSLDGKTMAFAGVEGTDPRTQIYTVDATTGEGLVALTSCAGQAPGCSNDYPAWSPDGRSIVFIHTDDYDAKENAVNAQVWVMDADGGNQHALTTDSVTKDQVPDWSPDGSQIAYAGGPSDSEGIWVMNADGSKQHQVSGCLAADASPCQAGSDTGPGWSPDGASIAFLRGFGAVGANDRPIFTMDADGSNQERVNQGTILAAVPSWQ